MITLKRDAFDTATYNKILRELEIYDVDDVMGVSVKIAGIDREYSIIRELTEKNGAQFWNAEGKKEFYTEYYDWYGEEGPVDEYAWLNTLFGYDIGMEKANKIMSFVFDSYGEIHCCDLKADDDTFHIMKTVDWFLELNLNFDNFGKYKTIRYDW